MSRAALRRKVLALEAHADADSALDQESELSFAKSVFGIYAPGPTLNSPQLLRCWQKQHGKWAQVDAEPQIQIPLKAEPLLLKKKRYKLLIGGRGSSKSETISAILAAQSREDAEKIACFREYQSSIDDSVYSLICRKINELNLDGFLIRANRVLHYSGGFLKFKGLQKPDSMKSADAYRRFWVEEAQAMSKKSLTLMTPTLRTPGSEIFMSANPGSRKDAISKKFLIPFEKQLLRDGYYEDDLHLIIVMNYRDNPWFPQVLEDERLNDKEIMSDAEYEHVWNGAYNDSVENAIIPTSWFDAAIDAHIKLGFQPRGVKHVCHDPSDTGPDSKGLILRQGSVILHAEEMETGDINDGSDWATDFAIAHGADHYSWDGDGMGVALLRGVTDAFSNTKIEAEMFKGSEAVDFPDVMYHGLSRSSMIMKPKKNKDTFKNKRAQYYWALRERFWNTYRAIVKGERHIDPDSMISISSEIKCIDLLRSEVCTVPLKISRVGNGLIQIMSKEEMKAEGIDSPNLADSLMMSERSPIMLAKPQAKIPRSLGVMGRGRR